MQVQSLIACRLHCIQALPAACTVLIASHECYGVSSASKVNDVVFAVVFLYSPVTTYTRKANLNACGNRACTSPLQQHRTMQSDMYILRTLSTPRERLHPIAMRPQRGVATSDLRHPTSMQMSVSHSAWIQIDEYHEI